MNELLSALLRDGFTVPEIILNGRLIRFDRAGKKSGWFVGFEFDAKGGEKYIVAVYGDWKTGEKFEYKTDREYTKTQQTEILKKIKLAQQEGEREREKLQESAKREALALWDTGGENGRSDYLSRKQITALHGCRTTLGTDGRVVMVPMRDSFGELWGVQQIHPDGKKYFLVGQRIKGCFHTLAESHDALELASTIYIAEGFSTAASIFQAIQQPVVCAFNASNLVTVAEELKDKYPTASFVICCDDDQFTERDGQAYNPGREFGEKAAGKCAGSTVYPLFTSLESKPTDFNDMHLLEGLGAVRDQILGAEDAQKQYVLCLGFNEDRYFYTSSQNKYIRDLSAAAHNKIQLMSLIDLSYWAGLYPSQGEDGVNWTMAIDDLMHRCRQKGPFNLNNVRATGTWLGDKKDLVLNRGDLLITQSGERKDFHSIKSRYVYEPGDLLLPDPSKDHLSNAQCQDFLETLLMLRWGHKDYYKFLAGWLMIAPICGALEWRPHLWLSGPSGSGKSTIMNEVVHRILRKTALFFQGQSTEAGIRQSLAKKAIAVVFDEFETNDERSGFRINSVVELFRQASYETDAFIVKGTSDGQAMQFLPRFAGLVSSVNVNLQFEADRNRFTIIELQRPSDDQHESAKHFEKFQKKLDTLTDDWVQLFYSRIFNLWDVFVHNRAMLFQVISEKYNARFGQQYGALLAGYSILDGDVKLTRDHAEFIVNTTDLELKAKEQDDSDENECLRYLLSKRVYVNGSISTDATIYEIINNARSSLHQKDEWQKVLRQFGMTIKDDAVLLANNHSEINGVFKGTKWAALYNRSLVRIKGVDNNKNQPVWMNGRTVKVTRLPLSVLGVKE